MEAYVTLTIENEVGFIEFFHPNRNSMPSTILSLLEQAIIDAGENDDVKVIVLKVVETGPFVLVQVLMN